MTCTCGEKGYQPRHDLPHRDDVTGGSTPETIKAPTDNDPQGQS